MKPKPIPFKQANIASPHGKKIQDVFTATIPHTLHCGNKYVMVMVKVDSNAILLEQLKKPELICGYDSLIKCLLRAGVTPKKHALDNEISQHVKHHIKDNYHFTLKLVLPGCYHCNAAKVTICNFKAYFLNVLAGTADSFPPSLWDHLLPQTKITLNLLHQSNAMPTVSAYAHLSGPFNYNKMPLSPMGCKVQVHEKIDKQGTWAFHCVNGWYLNTSPEHYQVHYCHIKGTGSEQLSDTVRFKHKNLTYPSLTPEDILMKAIANCKAALTAFPASPQGTNLHDLQTLVDQDQAHAKSPINPVNQPLF
ncbi:LOW QUALITY PROTEIN: hypothetical protein ACHAW6_011742 [Cyclotella cf. meneghiniana]